jgi:hypothetical protein
VGQHRAGMFERFGVARSLSGIRRHSGPLIPKRPDEERWLDPKPSGNELLLAFDASGMAIEAE